MYAKKYNSTVANGAQRASLKFQSNFSVCMETVLCFSSWLLGQCQKLLSRWELTVLGSELAWILNDTCLRWPKWGSQRVNAWISRYKVCGDFAKMKFTFPEYTSFHSMYLACGTHCYCWGNVKTPTSAEYKEKQNKKHLFFWGVYIHIFKFRLSGITQVPFGSLLFHRIATTLLWTTGTWPLP